MKILKTTITIILGFLIFACESDDSPNDEPQNLDTNPYIGNVVLNTQQEINDFGVLNHTSISGDLIISNTSSNINDLSKLNTLIYIGYDLVLEHISFNLNNLNGLNNITEIGRDLKIISVDKLLSLNGLDNLKIINRNLQISNNPRLGNINALNNLERIEGNLYILNNGSYEFAIGINDFCSLSNLIISNGLIGDFAIVGNKGYNPTEDDIINGNCSE